MSELPLSETTTVVTLVNRKAPVVFTLLTAALALVLALEGKDGDTTFRLATDTDFFELPEMRVAEYVNTSTPLSDVVMDVNQANPPTTWSESENIKWKVNLPGSGNATPIIWGD